MGSDRARVSYDPERQYRSVVLQQGRVSLESDWNEAWQIAAEEQRRQALDLVGPSGALGDGFRIALERAKDGEGDADEDDLDGADFWVHAGTLYLGGVRASLPHCLRYSRQGEWQGRPHAEELDRTAGRQHELVYLGLHEQEVSAEEDEALSDVALGGRDTAHRTRLIQRIGRLPLRSGSREEAAEEAHKHWHERGLHWDRVEGRLDSLARLQVHVSQPDEVIGFEETGGQAGAENQLIRVQITDDGRVVWGYDNASQLYRIGIGDGKTVTLKRAPRDVYHYPKRNQAVEVLLPAVALGDGQWIAAHTGFVTTLAEKYDPDTGRLTLADDLPAHDRAVSAESALFLRVWERVLDLAPGRPLELAGTGLAIELTGESFHPGDYWTFSLRPGSAQYVFPARIHRTPQPPDGPRRWVSPLALISWEGHAKVQDLRFPLRNLTDTGPVAARGTTVTLSPADVAGGAGLQALLDGNDPAAPLTVLLSAGTYLLPAPLRLGARHEHLTLTGAHPGVLLRALDPGANLFLDGLIVAAEAARITLQNLHLVQPLVPYTGALEALGIPFQEAGDFAWLAAPHLKDLRVSVGLRLVQSTGVTIEKCTFEAMEASGAVFGAAVFLGGECQGLTLRGNRFMGTTAPLRLTGDRLHLLSGVLAAPAVAPDPKQDTRAGTVAAARVGEMRIEDNAFHGLTFAALLYAEMGEVKFADNRVRDCYAGFCTLSPRSLPFVEFLPHVPLEADADELKRQVHDGIRALAKEAAVILTTLLARLYPPPAGMSALKALPVSLKEALEEVLEAPVRGALEKAESEVGKTARGIEREIAPLISLFKRIALWQGLTPPPHLPVGGQTPEAAGLEIAKGSLLALAFPLHQKLAALEREALTHQGQAPSSALSLRFSGNDIDALAGGAPSGPALLVWDDERDTCSMLILSENKLENRSLPLPTTLILLVHRCIIRGNFFLNESEGSEETFHSLVLVAGEQQAFSGNVFRGAHTP